MNSILSPRQFLSWATILVLTAAHNSPPTTISNSLFLQQIAQSVSLPASTWSANGTHTAKGFTSANDTTTDVQGMAADCENINLNKKIAVNFSSDAFGDGLIGYFYKCEKISPDTNLYWFTISSGNAAQIDRLCDPNTRLPIVFDSQHDTWWIDEPFDCIQRTGPGNGEF